MKKGYGKMPPMMPGAIGMPPPKQVAMNLLTQAEADAILDYSIPEPPA